MPDCSQGTIWIGGKVPRALLGSLAKHLKYHGCVGDDFDEADVEAGLREFVEPDDLLKFVVDEAPGGSFFELEEWLKENRIDFDRDASESHYYESETVKCRGGNVHTFDRVGHLNLVDNLVVVRRAVYDVLDKGRSIREALAAFDATVPKVPPLAPFEVVNE